MSGKNEKFFDFLMCHSIYLVGEYISDKLNLQYFRVQMFVFKGYSKNKFNLFFSSTVLAQNIYLKNFSIRRTVPEGFKLLIEIF